MSRESFSKTVKLKLAQRAAYRCSFPSCNRLTIGPGLRDDDIENTGKAAHIYSASEYGPRGQGTLTPAELSAITNGIWMCSNHADLIDKNTGLRYSVSVLKSWKALHEYRINYEHSGQVGAFGFIRSIAIHASPCFEPSVIEFGKTTFLVGKNGSGKTALLDWISVIDNPRRLWRWLKPCALHYDLLFDVPGEHRLAVVSGNDAVQFKLDGKSVAFNHHRIAIALISKRHAKEAKDDLGNISSLFNLDDISVRSLAGLVGHPKMFLAGARFEQREDNEGEKREVLLCKLQSGAEMTYDQLSGGEQGRVVMEFAIAHMSDVALFAPAMLIIERPNLHIDNRGFAIYLDYFASNECVFQTIVTQFSITEDISIFGCQIYQLSGMINKLPGTIKPVLHAQTEY